MKQIITTLLILVISLNCKAQRTYTIKASDLLDSSLTLYSDTHITHFNITDSIYDIWQQRYNALNDMWKYCVPQVKDRKKFKIALKRYRELMKLH